MTVVTTWLSVSELTKILPGNFINVLGGDSLIKTTGIVAMNATNFGFTVYFHQQLDEHQLHLIII